MRLLIPLFSPVTGTWGGLTRVVALARAAQSAGHSAAFCASGYLEKTLRAQGFQVYSTPPATMFGLPEPLSRLIAKRSQDFSLPVKPGKSFGSIWFVLMLSGMATADYLQKLVEAELAAARDFQADGLVTDLDLGAYLTADITGTPVATTYQQVMSQGQNSFAWKVAARAVARVLKSYSRPVIPPDELAFGLKVLKIIPSIPELEGADPNRADICYVGSLLGEIQAGGQQGFLPEEGQRYLFVYTGTGSVTQKALRTVLPGLLANKRGLKAIVGGTNRTDCETIGAVEFRPYVSAEALLPFCDWTICHGGQNTIIQSLLHGVPLLVFPGPIFERRFNARKVEEAGAGRMGEIPDFHAGWIERALGKQADYACCAQTLGQRVRSFGGAPEAIRAIEFWVKANS